MEHLKGLLNITNYKSVIFMFLFRLANWSTTLSHKSSSPDKVAGLLSLWSVIVDLKYVLICFNAENECPQVPPYMSNSATDSQQFTVVIPVTVFIHVNPGTPV